MLGALGTAQACRASVPPGFMPSMLFGASAPPPKLEEEILDAALDRAPIASVQAKAAVSARHEPVTREATEKERVTLAGDGTETVSVSAAAEIARCSHDTMLRLVEQCAIEAQRVASRGWWRVERTSLTQFLNRCGGE